MLRRAMLGQSLLEMSSRVLFHRVWRQRCWYLFSVRIHSSFAMKNEERGRDIVQTDTTAATAVCWLFSVVSMRLYTRVVADIVKDWKKELQTIPAITNLTNSSCGKYYSGELVVVFESVRVCVYGPTAETHWDKALWDKLPGAWITFSGQCAAHWTEERHTQTERA